MFSLLLKICVLKFKTVYLLKCEVQGVIIQVLCFFLQLQSLVFSVIKESLLSFSAFRDQLVNFKMGSADASFILYDILGPMQNHSFIVILTDFAQSFDVAAALYHYLVKF